MLRRSSSRVIQAYYAEPAVPASLARSQVFSARNLREGTHPARVFAALPRHPAQRAVASALPPHPAQRRLATPSSPVQRAGAPSASAEVSAFQTPAGFLERAASGRGDALPPTVRKKMETFFGVDFSDVRVRVGSEAAAIGALAFTVGSEIYFAPGQYDPHSRHGQELLGHELAHVVQQREGRVANPYGDGLAVVQDAALEAEADRLGQAAAAGRARTACAKMVSALGGRDAHPAFARAAPGRAMPAQARSAYQLIVGAYMHEAEKALPAPLAGHTFVALERPNGERQTWGFSPAHYGDYDPNRDLGRLSAGVAGVVHSDESALEKPGVRLRSYAIDANQAEAALAKVAEYQTGQHRFALRERQCSTFAVDVLRAARLTAPNTPRVWMPREMYDELGDAT